ncbi:MAG: aminotransferase class III-fold pyridoxal phosphate-dependent enzyme, partial [Desulfobacteraceae bacterium]|nr:aminotransferase class III-fold pyridoxal phosphate-dependent enzyme [Desulfobacteraceae bacterium]
MSNMVRHAPRFSEDQAAELAGELFTLQVRAECLPSERDQNFRLRDEKGEQFVLKIANAAETREVLEFQNQAMRHVAEKAAALFEEFAPCPRVCSDPNGEEIISIPGQDGASHYVRLLTYLPGKPLATVNPHDNDLLFSLGSFLGRIDRLLMDFAHPASRRAFHWDLARCGKAVASRLDDIDDPEKRDLVQHRLDRYRADTVPKLVGLRASVIHSDGNDYNVLASPHGRWGNRVTGLIDFGDMVHSHTINELAIACAYATMGKSDPLAAAVQVVAGYHRAFALTESELAVLFDLICMRLCTSVCHSAHQIRLAPQNTYLLISQQPGWELLNRLQSISPAFAEAIFRDACGFDPAPRSRHIVAWLKDNQASLVPVVDEALLGGHPPIIDLSVGTSLIGADAKKADAQAMTRLIFREMEDAGHAIGIGRYNEARVIYTADAFKVETDTAPEYRTVHLGLDLFARPGEPVYAFMGGRVHSVRNNAGHQDYGPTIILSHETDSGIPFYSLYGHLAATSLDGLEPGMSVSAGQTIGTIGTSTENGGWAPHLHFQLITDLLGLEGNFPGVARPSQRRVWTALCPDPGVVLGRTTAAPTDEVRRADEIMAIRQRHLGKNLSVSYHTPLKIVRGMGGFLYTETGQPYMDGVNNVCHVGHCHPSVVAAGQRQMAVLNTNTRYLHDNIVDYARRLLATFPETLSVCFFVCSGSEANELALRLARTYTGQQDII